MSAVKTVQEKFDALNARKKAERELGAQIDRVIARADAEQSGCGICHIWRRLTGWQRSAALLAVVDADADDAAVAVKAVKAKPSASSSSRLFGTKKTDPQSALTAAAESMNSRILQLESRAAHEREEAKRAMASGQKSSALRLLKKSKATDKQIAANMSTLVAIEQQVDLMAQAQMQRQVASALASSSKGMKAQKSMLKSAETAVDDAQEARDMAEDLTNVMGEFVQASDLDDTELLHELESMVSNDAPQAGTSDEEQPISDAAVTQAARMAEAAKLEARIARHDQSVANREAAAAMPSAPTGAEKKANVKQEKERLLVSSGS